MATQLLDNEKTEGMNLIAEFESMNWRSFRRSSPSIPGATVVRSRLKYGTYCWKHEKNRLSLFRKTCLILVHHQGFFGLLCNPRPASPFSVALDHSLLDRPQDGLPYARALSGSNPSESF